MRALSLALAISLGGCFPRVTLPPPPAVDAPVEVRRQAFADFNGTPTKATLPDGGTGPTEGLLLGNGTLVQDPRDLVPWVLPESRTAAFATSFETSQSRASVLGSAAVAFPLLPIFAIVGSIAVPSLSGRKPNIADTSPILYAGMTGALFAMGLTLTAVIISATALGERNQAFEAYPADLAQRLGLSE